MNLIVLTAITGDKIAIGKASIFSIVENKKNQRIEVNTHKTTWYIDCNIHSVESIVDLLNS